MWGFRMREEALEKWILWRHASKGNDTCGSAKGERCVKNGDGLSSLSQPHTTSSHFKFILESSIWRFWYWWYFLMWEESKVCDCAFWLRPPWLECLKFGEVIWWHLQCCNHLLLQYLCNFFDLWPYNVLAMWTQFQFDHACQPSFQCIWCVIDQKSHLA